MDIFSRFLTDIQSIIEQLYQKEYLSELSNISRIQVEPPRDPAHGDLATNAALVLAKSNGLNPRDLAQKLAEELEKNDDIAEVSIAGAGFVNLKLNNSVWYDQLRSIIQKNAEFGKSDMGKGQIVNVEYVSANPTGPLHVGHCRGAILGDTIANILTFTGFNVTKEYYINDAGGQVDILARSVYLRYAEALGNNLEEIPEGLYPGAYLIPVGKALADIHGDRYLDTSETEYLPIFRKFAVDAMMDIIKQQLDELGVHHDVFTSEYDIVHSGKMTKAIDYLKDKGIIYQGYLEKPKGGNLEDWEETELTLFKSSDYGDDVDRPLFKSSGAHTYFASDIAYHFDKYQRGALKQIDILGADHAGYVKRMKAGVRAMSEDKASLEAKLCQIVRLFDNGQPVKMSKRAGNFITTSDVIKAVGKDVTRFIMLTRSADTQLDFDFTKVKEMSKDNPVFYVQYAHARICSVKRQLQDVFGDMDGSDAALLNSHIFLLNHEGELAIIRHLARWEMTVRGAAEYYEPHRIANYLYDLAALIHGQWSCGNDDESLRFIIQNDVNLSLARFTLLRCVQIVLACGLNLFGVEPKEAM